MLENTQIPSTILGTSYLLIYFSQGRNYYHLYVTDEVAKAHQV